MVDSFAEYMPLLIGFGLILLVLTARKVPR
jgi:hypothetical protein